MPSKRLKKHAKLAVDTAASSATTTSTTSGNRSDMAPGDKVHHHQQQQQYGSPLQQLSIGYQPQYQCHQYQQQPYQQYQQGYYMVQPTDQELLEDFCAYLENRVLTKNLALLRRMLTEFLSRQELTLAQFKCFGANLIAVLPFDVLNKTKRRHADLLLQKKKHPPVDQTCAFQFLFVRVATKNLSMLKQMFLEFRTHKESSIHEFVKQGVAAVSIVPYDPPHLPPVERFAYYPPPYAPRPPYPPTQFAVSSSPVSPQQYHYYQQQQQQYAPQQGCHYPQQQQFEQHPPPHQCQPQQYAQSFLSNDQHGNNAHGDGDGDAQDGVTPKPERVKKIPTSHRKSQPAAQDISTRSPIGSTAPNANNTSSSSAHAVGKRVVKKPVRYYKEQKEDELIAAVAKSSRRAKKEQLAAAAASEPALTLLPHAKLFLRKARGPNSKGTRMKKTRKVATSNNNNNNNQMMMMDLDFSDSEEGQQENEDDDDELGLHELEFQKQLSNANGNSGSKRTIDSMIDETLRQFEEHAEAEAEAEKRKLKLRHRLLERQGMKEEKDATPLRQHPAATSLQASSSGENRTARPPVAAPATSIVKASLPGLKRGNEASLRFKAVVRDKLRAFEARLPWKQVFRDLPLPFDEHKAPKLAEKLRLFWRVHARAAWERNFWMPLAQDDDSKANSARKARQRLARLMFDEIICGVFRVLGAEFFVHLDEQKHPGWWYRGPIIDIFAYRRVVGDQKCWEFVESQLCARFPDCGLELPLKSPNYGVLRRHKCESAAMWSNIPKTALILRKIVALKERRARGGELAAGAGNGGSSGSPSPIDPEACVEEEKEEEDEEADGVVRDENGAENEAKAIVPGVDNAGDEVNVDDDEDDDDHGEDMILLFATDTDAADDEDEEDDEEESEDEDGVDEEEELLIEKIALEGSFETADTALQAALPATAKTVSSLVASPVDASAIAIADGIAVAESALTESVGAVAAEENGAKAAATDGEIAANASAGADTGDAATALASDKDAGKVAAALARGLEPACFAEFIRKIIPFGSGEKISRVQKGVASKLEVPVVLPAVWLPLTHCLSPMASGECRRGDSEIFVAFPALTRAKQRFLERQAAATAGASAVAPRAPPSSSSRSEPPLASCVQDGTAAQAVSSQPTPSSRSQQWNSATSSSSKPPFLKLLLDFCADLDDDLRVLTDDVHAIDVSVHQDHQQICDVLDALTTTFINGQLSVELQTEKLFRVSETEALRGSLASRCEKTDPTSNQRLNSQTKRTTTTNKAGVSAQQSCQQPLKPPSCLSSTHNTHSRAALLARQAVHAHVIQHHYRHFLYCRLYSGGRTQFAVANQLCRRASLARVWRRWKDDFLSQRRESKAKFARIESRLRARAQVICTRQAAQMRESDGKYAMAKRFHESKALCDAFRRWLFCP